MIGYSPTKLEPSPKKTKYWTGELGSGRDSSGTQKPIGVCVKPFRGTPWPNREFRWFSGTESTFSGKSSGPHGHSDSKF